MSPNAAVVIAYGIITLFLWGLAGKLLLECRKLRRSR